MPPSDDGNGWPEWRKLIKHQLEETEKRLGCIDAKLDRLRLDFATLKVKAGIWGGVGLAALAVIDVLVRQL